jgi:heat shock protein HslJ
VSCRVGPDFERTSRRVESSLPCRMSGCVGAALGLALLFAACRTPSPAAQATGPSTSSSTLAGTAWLVEDIDGRGVVERGRATMTFETAERVVGSTGCNRYFAPATLAGSTLRFGSGGSTRMACPPAVMDQERRFLEALASIRAYQLDGATLQLLDERGRVVVRLARSPEAGER